MSGRRTYLINPIWAVGFVTRSLCGMIFSFRRIKKVWEWDLLFTEKQFFATYPWRGQQARRLSSPCLTDGSIPLVGNPPTLPTPGQKIRTLKCVFLLTFLVFICTAFYHDWTTFVGNVAGFYQDHLQGIEVILKSCKIDTFIQKNFISNCCHHVPPRCYSQSCQASAWSCRGFPRVAPCLSPGWELSCLLAPGRRLWVRDVPLFQICVFLTRFKRGGGSNPCSEKLQIS